MYKNSSAVKFIAYFTDKNGVKHYAKDYGKKCFVIYTGKCHKQQKA